MDAIFARLFPAPKGPHPQGNGAPDGRGKDGRSGAKASNEGVLRTGLLADRPLLLPPLSPIVTHSPIFRLLYSFNYLPLCVPSLSPLPPPLHSRPPTPLSPRSPLAPPQWALISPSKPLCLSAHPSAFAAGSGLLLAAHHRTSPLALAADPTDTQQQVRAASTMLPLGSLAVAVADVAAEALPTVREPGTGVEFPVLLSDAGEGAGEGEKAEKEGKKGKKGGKEGRSVAGDRTLAGVGVRNKNLLGLKNIKVYAYGEW
ncbi:unnamed protein product [Closterium sp. NIES-64]|nr:unnamed protein product [Closterium sp. NIES-64]